MKKISVYIGYKSDFEKYIIIDEFKDKFIGFSVFDNIGIWNKEIEKSVKIELIIEGTNKQESLLENIINDIKIQLNQLKVLITKQDILSELI